jgi:hypothetical protein
MIQRATVLRQSGLPDTPRSASVVLVTPWPRNASQISFGENHEELDDALAALCYRDFEFS